MSDDCGNQHLREVFRQKVISRAADDGCFQALEDGLYYFWPLQSGGVLSAAALRVIAEELDRRNSDWDDHVRSAQQVRND